MAQNPLALSPHHIFGVNSEVRDNIHFLDERNVVYSAGSHLVLMNIDTNIQKIIPLQPPKAEATQKGQILSKEEPQAGTVKSTKTHATEENSQQTGGRSHMEPFVINIMAMSPNKKYLAIGYNAITKEGSNGFFSEPPSVDIWDLNMEKKIKTITISETASQKVISISFTADNIYMLAQTGAPDFALYAWNWDKGKLHGHLAFGELLRQKPKANSMESIDEGGHLSPNRRSSIVGQMSNRRPSIVGQMPNRRPSIAGQMSTIKPSIAHAPNNNRRESVQPGTRRESIMDPTKQATMAGQSRRDSGASQTRRSSRASFKPAAKKKEKSSDDMEFEEAQAQILNQHHMHMQDFEIHQASFNPFEAASYQVCISGTFFFRVVRFTPDQPYGLRMSGLGTPLFKTYNRHVWLTKDRIAVGTLDNRVFIAESGEIKYEVSFFPKSVIGYYDKPEGAKYLSKRLEAVKEDSDSPDKKSEVDKSKPAENIEDSISTMLAFQDGFLIGTKRGVIVAFGWINPEGQQQTTRVNPLAVNYRQLKDWHLGSSRVLERFHGRSLNRERGIRDLALCPSEDVLIVLQDEHQLCCASFTNPIGAVITGEFNIPDSQQRSVELQPLALPYHCAPIVDMSLCPHKAILATCSLDKSVRVWNYLECALECTERFPDQPCSLSLHPSGSFLVVGFQTSVKLFTVLVDSLRPVWDANLNSCHKVSFSRGGQYFVVASEFSLYLFSTWQQELLAVAEAHSSDVREIQWGNLDKTLLTAGYNGLVYQWEITVSASPIEAQEGRKDFITLIKQRNHGKPTATKNSSLLNYSLKKLGEFHTQKTMLNGLAYAIDAVDSVPINRVDAPFIVHACSDASVRMVSQTKTYCYKTGNEWTNISFDNKTKLFSASTSGGSICLFQYPTIESRALEYMEFSGHRGPAKQILFSFDSNFLFTTGLDGCIIVYKIAPKETNAASRWNTVATAQMDFRRRQSLDMSAMVGMSIDRRKSHNPLLNISQYYSDEVLITKQDYVTIHDKIKEFQAQEQQYVEQVANELRIKDKALDERMLYVVQEHDEKVKEIRRETENIKLEHKKQTETFQKYILHIKEQHKAAKEECRIEYGKRTAIEREKAESLLEKIRIGNIIHQKRIEEALAIRESQLENLKQSYELKLEAMKDQMKEIKERTAALSKEHAEFEKDLDLTLDEELCQLQHYYETQLKLAKESTTQCQIEMNETNAQHSSLLKEVALYKNRMMSQQETVKQLHVNISRLQTETEALMKDNKEKDEAENDRDKSIAEEKKKKQELDKTKFMLENKIDSENKHLEPREQRRQVLKYQFEEMLNELNLLKSQRRDKKTLLKKLGNRYDAIEKQIVREKQRVIGFQLESKRIAEEFQEIYAIVDTIERNTHPDQHHKLEVAIKKSLTEFFRRHCESNGPRKVVPKGYTGTPEAVGDQSEKRALNLPYLVEQTVKENRHHPQSQSSFSREELTHTQRIEQDLNMDLIEDIFKKVAVHRSWFDQLGHDRLNRHKEIEAMNDNRQKNVKKFKAEIAGHLVENEQLVNEMNSVMRELKQRKHNVLTLKTRMRIMKQQQRGQPLTISETSK